MVRVSWDSPLTTVTGKAASKVVKETGFETIGELLSFYPRTYVERGRLSDLGKLKWFNNHWELNNPDSRMYVEDGDALDRMPALIPIYREVGKLNTWQIE